MTTTEIEKLNGRIVLVQPSHSTHNPPTGRRGTLELVPGTGGTERPQLQISLVYPDMFNRPAETKIIKLTTADLETGLQIAPDGDCHFVYSGPLD